MVRRKQSFIESATNLISMLPWWAGSACAVVSFLLLRWYAVLQFSSGHGENLVHKLPMFGQYLLPGVFLAAALLSAVKRSKRKNLYYSISDSVTQESLNDLSWRDFEYLVREYFSRRGFNVEKARSGVDLIARKDREKYLIQCQQWKICENGVQLVRELSEAVAGDEAARGIVVTSGEFTKDATASANANNILLLGGRELHYKIKSDVKAETRSDRGKRAGLRKAKWVLAFLLLLAICFSAFRLGEISTSFHSTLSDQIKKIYPDKQKHLAPGDIQSDKQINRAESTDTKFTDDQIRQAIEEVMNKKRRQQFEIGATAPEQEELNYIYEIELISGGWIYTDNAKITETKISYKSADGIVVSIDRVQVKAMKKRKVAN